MGLELFSASDKGRGSGTLCSLKAPGENNGIKFGGSTASLREELVFLIEPCFCVVLLFSGVVLQLATFRMLQAFVEDDEQPVLTMKLERVRDLLLFRKSVATLLKNGFESATKDSSTLHEILCAEAQACSQPPEAKQGEATEQLICSWMKKEGVCQAWAHPKEVVQKLRAHIQSGCVGDLNKKLASLKEVAKGGYNQEDWKAGIQKSNLTVWIKAGAIVLTTPSFAALLRSRLQAVLEEKHS